MTTDFSKTTRDNLAKRCSYLCSNPDCRKNTSVAHTSSNKAVVFGEAAHIKGQTNRSARFDTNLSLRQIKDMDNGVWLCRDCHKKVDSDEVKYPVDLLKEWKVEAENNKGDYRQIIQETTDQAIRKTLTGFGINVSGFVPKLDQDVLKDRNIKLSFDEWFRGNIGNALKYSEAAYYSSSGDVKLQSIVNIILLEKDELSKYGFLISLCDEGINLATNTKSISTRGVLKAHKVRLLNHRVFENAIAAYAETQMRELTGFPSLNNSQLAALAQSVNSDANMVQLLAKEAQEDAIQAKNNLAMAHIKMTLASTMGQMYLLTKQIGGNYGQIEHYVLKTYLEARDIYKAYKDKEGVAYVLHNLANNMRFFGNKERALEFILEAEKESQVTKNKELQNKIGELKQRLISPNDNSEK